MLEPINPIKPGTPMPGKVPPPFDPKALGEIVNSMVNYMSGAGGGDASPQWLANVKSLCSTLGKLLDCCGSRPIDM